MVKFTRPIDPELLFAPPDLLGSESSYDSPLEFRFAWQAMIDGNWLPSHRADPRALALYKRHYSAKKTARWRLARSLNFVGPGKPMVLLTLDCDALFVWLHNTVQRYDRQVGVICTVFRNESPVLSSTMIREADALAWPSLPGKRLFTYVDPSEIRSTNPGACFKHAGWRRCGTSAGGLHILELLPSELAVAA